MIIWIVLPAYDEELALPFLLQSLIDSLTEEKREFRIVVVNDGSSDRTGEIVENFCKTSPVLALHNNPNKGLAETIRRGLIHATQLASPKDVIITMDADNTHPAGLAIRMVRLIREGNDVVIASRYRPGSRVLGVPWHRRLLSWGASLIFRTLFPTPGVKDFTCGYRAYRAGVLQELVRDFGPSFVSVSGFSCMVDILLKLRARNVVFGEVPLVLRYDLKPGRSKMDVAKTIVQTLLLIFQRRFSWSYT